MTVVGVWMGGVLLLAELLNRFASVDSEITRKIVHIGTGNVILLAWWLQIPAWVGITAAVLASAIALLSYRLPILPGVNSVGRLSFGTLFYAISIGVLVAWFWPLQQPQYAALGILVMTYGDGLAAIIGQKFGKHPYKLWGIQKSWEGSLTMALVSYVVSCLILLAVQGAIWPTWLVPAVIAISATSLEAFSKYGIDNLTVPIGGAAVAFFLNQFLMSIYL
ncbi:diacylglycerol/polyprenol kinase family protein [Microcoleus sp. FACHB-68]|uniref:diacylglycerol/polyprenol kinase family protein n=1 Tax=Microcoleus sp. FACHB-68 TaxID=2692826 RepID=UPI0016874B69|nr:diacylglycerol/polyprenol kinase family protein [Microcoleus sp. FACHB-68]MBD1937567.1 phosphatidate cytidylyltransferase [Microcoleus sp. FACHB-68]